MKRSREEMDEPITKQFNDFKEEMRKMMAGQFEKQTSTLREIQQTNHSIESSVAYLTAQNDELKKQLIHLEHQTREDKKYIKILENRIEEIQIGNRKTNFVIKNVPKSDSETKDDLVKMVTTLSQNLNCSISKNDVKDIYRVRSRNKENRNTPIVVETSSTILKTEILKMAKVFNSKHKSKLCCKQLGFKTQVDVGTYIFV
ncbi:unnamed protein product [Euphydryas editha]|uniref:Uncharacterized protein n=2 Tax=Euphydryas editha TaxID=104508 RepID=A0AAU9TY10_EUPED|nr:unnamed protein product [Euphydryas editha]